MPEERAHIATRVRPDEANALDELARLNARTRSAELAVALRAHLRRAELDRQVAALTDEELKARLLAGGIPVETPEHAIQHGLAWAAENARQNTHGAAPSQDGPATSTTHPSTAKKEETHAGT